MQAIYEKLFGIYDSSYQLIFDTLRNAYVFFVIFFFLLPLVLWALFYFAYQNPYATVLHWFGWLAVSVIIVAILTGFWAWYEIYAVNAVNSKLSEELNKPSSAYKAYAALLPLKYALVNCLLAAILSAIFSLIFKQFSKVQTHLPV